ncbi:MAG: esterase/lipase family protein [Synechococcaceae cyanobacterium]
MADPQPPLVLVHGLWDSPRLFRRLVERLDGARDPLLIPHLPHGVGVVPLEQLAADLGGQIQAAFGSERPVDVLGFSMGGVIGRTWIQLLGGQRRVRRLISVGSPQRGTWIAQPWPRPLLAGVADMKRGSRLLRRLNDDPAGLAGVECLSFYCPTDAMVVPGWQAVLPVGERRALPVWTHQQLIRHPRAVEALARELLRT